MKNIKGIISITSIYIVGALFFISCAQDGRDARDGRNGFDGFNGRDGLANIQSNTYFVGTGDVIVTGLVQAYFSLDANPNTRRWIALPYVDFGYSYVQGFTTLNIMIILVHRMTYGTRALSFRKLQE